VKEIRDNVEGIRDKKQPIAKANENLTLLPFQLDFSTNNVVTAREKRLKTNSR
jgi:hypothetical protein